MRICQIIYTATLAAIALAPASHAMGVSGTITTTTWTKANSPYVVTDTITVPAGNTLTIEAGVDVRFYAQTELVVHGALHATGAPADTVRFIGLYNGWSGIRIENADSCSFTWCEITGVSRRDGSVQRNGGGFLIDNTRVDMSHVVIAGNALSAANHYIDEYPIDERGEPHGGGLAALNGARVTISYGIFKENSVSASHWGPIRYPYPLRPIACGGAIAVYDASVTLYNSALIRNRANESGAAIRQWGGDVTLINCVVAGNHTPTTSYGPPGHTLDGTRIRLNSTIWWDNGGAAPDAPSIQAEHCDIEHLIHGQPWPGVGNISADPLFAVVGRSDYSLSPGSPCIDSGDPALPRDDDGSLSDMGPTGRTGPIPAISGMPQIQVMNTRYISSTRYDSVEIVNRGNADLLLRPLGLPAAFTSPVAANLNVAPRDTVQIPLKFVGTEDLTGATITVSSSDPVTPLLGLYVIGVLGTAISGEIPTQTWTADLNPYRVHCTVPPGETLTVEAGVVVSAIGAIVVRGKLVVNGTEGDPVRFGGGSQWGWAGFTFSGDTSYVSHAVIEGASKGGASGGSYPISLVSGGGAYVAGPATSVTFDDCVFRGNSASAYIMQNYGGHTIGFGGAVCVDSSASVSISRSVLTENGSGGGGVAVASLNGGRLRLDRCVLYANVQRAYRFVGAPTAPGVVYVSGAITDIRNCTFYGNVARRRESPDIFATHNVGVMAQGSDVSIHSSIVWGDTSNIPQEAIRTGGSDYVEALRCNLVSPYGERGSGNFTTDPLFVDPENGDFRLQARSPCIDRGDPTQLDPDGSRSDIGAIPFGEEWPPLPVEQTTVPPRFALSQNRPNPFNPTTRIALSLPDQGSARLTVYDVTGRAVRTLVDDALGAGEHDVVWDGNDDAGRPCASGLYVYRLMVSGGSDASAERGERSQTRRMLLLR